MLELTGSRSLIEANEYVDWLLDLRNKVTSYTKLEVNDTVVTAMIDEALSVATSRNLIEAVEAMDFALDLRGLVADFQTRAHNAEFAESLVLGGIA